MKYLIVFLLCMGMAYAAYPVIYKSKAFNFNDPGIDAFEITLDINNVLYVWREIDGQPVNVATVENFCELEEW